MTNEKTSLKNNTMNFLIRLLLNHRNVVFCLLGARSGASFHVINYLTGIRLCNEG